MTYRFSVLITEEDWWYVARCPELNLTSQGKNVESAAASRSAWIELYSETWGIPGERPAEGQSFSDNRRNFRLTCRSFPANK